MISGVYDKKCYFAYHLILRCIREGGEDFLKLLIKNGYNCEDIACKIGMDNYEDLFGEFYFSVEIAFKYFKNLCMQILTKSGKRNFKFMMRVNNYPKNLDFYLENLNSDIPFVFNNFLVCLMCVDFYDEFDKIKYVVKRFREVYKNFDQLIKINKGEEIIDTINSLTKDYVGEDKFEECLYKLYIINHN